MTINWLLCNEAENVIGFVNLSVYFSECCLPKALGRVSWHVQFYLEFISLPHLFNLGVVAVVRMEYAILPPHPPHIIITLPKMGYLY